METEAEPKQSEPHRKVMWDMTGNVAFMNRQNSDSDPHVFNIQFKHNEYQDYSAMNPYLCHLGLDAGAFQGSRCFLSCSWAVKVHKPISWGDRQHS